MLGVCVCWGGGGGGVGGFLSSSSPQFHHSFLTRLPISSATVYFTFLLLLLLSLSPDAVTLCSFQHIKFFFFLSLSLLIPRPYAVFSTLNSFSSSLSLS